MPPVLLSILWAGFGHLQQPPQCMGGSGQVWSVLLHQLSVCGFFFWGKQSQQAALGLGTGLVGRGLPGPVCPEVVPVWIPWV